MSEYMEITSELSDDPTIMLIQTNLKLTDDGDEHYFTVDEMEEGSPLAQVLAYVDGLEELHIEGKLIRVKSDIDAPWHIIVTDISAAIKDFFL